MVVRVVTPEFKKETPEPNKLLVGMFEDLLQMVKDGRITSAAVAFTDDYGGGGAFGPTDISPAMATSLTGALANLQFQMHIAGQIQASVHTQT
jgi:hypothetical protein